MDSSIHYTRPPAYTDRLEGEEALLAKFITRYRKQDELTLVFRSNNVEMLNKRFGDVENLIIGTQIFDQFDAINLPELKKLHLEMNNIQKLDLRNFPSILKFTCEWHKEIHNMVALSNLEDLGLMYFSPNKKPLTFPPQVKKIRLTQSKLKNFKDLVIPDTVTQLRLFHNRSLRSLEGLEHLVNLKRLHLVTNSKVESLDILASFPELEWLNIEGQKKVNNLDVLSQLDRVEYLRIINCGEISSFRFLSEMKSLRNVVLFDTYCTESDVNYLNDLDMEYLVVVPKKKHYNVPIPMQKKDIRKDFHPNGYDYD